MDSRHVEAQTNPWKMKNLLSCIFCVFFTHLLIQNVIASPTLRRQLKCTNPTVRKEWGAANDFEKSSYINAALCLSTKPSRLGLPTTLYDDFGYIHNKLTLQSMIFPGTRWSPHWTNGKVVDKWCTVHGVAAFLPWHRYFVHIYEQALQECGYTGAAM